MSRWNILESLPEGVAWRLEASAGTGKTYQIASIVLRLVAAYGLPIDKILVMTFTRAATAELVARIRRRLQEAFDRLEVGAEPSTSKDEVLSAILKEVDAGLVRQRLLLALRSFDRAPISTIHGFSQQVLSEFAFETGQDAGLTLLESTQDLRAQVVDDALATLWSVCDERMVRVLTGLGVSRKTLLQVAQALDGVEAPRVVPSSTSTGTDWPSVWAPALGEVQPLLSAIDHFRRTHLPNGRPSDDVMRELSTRLEAGNVDASVSYLRRWCEGDGDLAESAPDETNLNVASRVALQSITRLDAATVQAVLDARPVKQKNKALKSLVGDEAYEKLSGSKTEFDLIYAANVPSGPAADFVRDYTALRDRIDAFRYSRALSPLALFGAAVRTRLDAEVRRRRSLTFDAMIERLAERIRTQGPSGEIATRLRERFEAVLVDEFQDTDAAQWCVLENAFLGHRRLFLIGDPKQAIYGFRGANVHVYMRASEKVPDEHRRTMTDNWRSDAVAVRAMNELWLRSKNAFDLEPTPQGAPGFDYVQVSPRPAAPEGTGPGLDVRWIPEVGTNVDSTQRKVMRLLQEEVLAWLAGPKTLDGGRRLMPQDLAVLVNNHHQGAAVRRAMEAIGVPVVAASKDHVMQSPAAGWIAQWLLAVADPRDERRARTAATTPIGGWSAEQLAWSLAMAEGRAALPAGLTIPDWAAWRARLSAAAQTFSAAGFARAFDREAAALQLFERLVAGPEGERHATDLRHLVEVIHAQDRQRRPTAGALAEWLLERISDANSEGQGGGGELAQRLESDAHALVIETIHASKGLEYPVVLMPFAWHASDARDPRAGPVKLQRADGTTVDLSVQGSSERERAIAEATAEARREALRRVYVALTRARHRTIVWWAAAGKEGARDADHTPFGRLLLRPPGSGTYAPGISLDPAEVRLKLEALAGGSSGAISCQTVDHEPSTPSRYEPGRSNVPVTLPGLDPRTELTSPWQRTSFSSLVPDDRLASRGVEGEGVAAQDAHAEALPPPAPVTGFGDRKILTLGAGTAYGSFVHGVFEDAGFVGVDPQLPRIAERRAREFDIPPRTRDEFLAHFPALLATPLDGGVTRIAKGWALSRLDRIDRRDELAFDLPLGAGEAWRRAGPDADDRARLSQLVDAVALANVPEPWVASLRHRLGRGELVGILNGKIDLVFRAPGEDGRERFYVLDYKTNLVGDGLPGAYTRPWLEWKMAGSDYLLQSLIYTVAVHRQLRQRMRSYDYDRDMGGYLYLFLRGMFGRETPRMAGPGSPCLGVFADRWPREVVDAVDAALGGTR